MVGPETSTSSFPSADGRHFLLVTGSMTTVRVWPSRSMPREIAPVEFCSASKTVSASTAVPLTEAMTSPRTRPAWAAGLGRHSPTGRLGCSLVGLVVASATQPVAATAARGVAVVDGRPAVTATP